jgi:peroxiredoxin
MLGYKPILRTLAAIVILSAAFVFTREVFSQLYPIGTFEVGMEANLEAQPALGGGKIKLSDYKNKKVVVLVFWLESCDLCLDQIEILRDYLKKNNRTNNVAVVLSTSGNKDELPLIKDAMKRRHINYPVILDPDLLVSRKFGASMAPSFVLIDRRGRVAANRISFVNRPVRDISFLKMIDIVRAGNNIPETQLIEYTNDGAMRKKIGTAAPAFSIGSLDGRLYKLQDYRGKMNVVLVFWNPVNPLCESVLIDLNLLYTTENRRRYNFVLLSAVSIYGDGQKDDVMKFLSQTEAEYPILNDSYSKVGKIYGVKKIPSVLVIDRGGKIVEAFSGNDMNPAKRVRVFLESIE